MVTDTQIQEWKAQYTYIYRATIDGVDYVFRTLSRDDYMDITAKGVTYGPTFDAELETTKLCLLTPIDEVELQKKSGLVSVLSEKIMARSGFVQVEDEEL